MRGESEAEKIPWIPLIIGVVIICFIGPFWVYMEPPGAQNWYALGANACFLAVPLSPFLFITGAYLLGRFGLFKEKVSLRILTIAYAAGLAIAQVTSNATGIPSNIIQFFSDRWLNELSMKYVPWFVAPPENIAKQVLTGGPIPWADWVPTIIFWWSLWGIGALFYVSVGTIFRRGWIELERIPFPHTLVMHRVITIYTRPAPSLRERLGRAFIIGAILGILWELPLLLINLFPWFPDIYGWRTNTCGPGSHWITPDSPLAPVVGLAMFNKDPLTACIFYMAPLGTLLSTLIFTIIFIILMQVAWYMGYYTGIESISGCGRVWCGTISYRVGEPFKWDVFTSAGVGTGIALFYLILNWRYLAETIKAAVGKLSEARRSEIEKNEPIPYRTSYLLLLIALVLSIILWIIYGLSAAPIAVIILVGLINAIAETRTYGLVGFVAPAGSWFGYGPYKLVLGDGLDVKPPSVEWVRAFTWAHFTGQSAWMTGWGFPLISSLSSYKMADLTGTDSRSVFKVVLVSSILAPLVAVIGIIWAFYTFGATRLPGAGWISWSHILGRAWPENVVTRPAYKPWVPHYIAGIITAGLLTFLHARFLWFPLDPIGLLLATDGHALIEGIWTTILAAYILKSITLKIGGSKLYEEVGIPAVSGFIAGYLVMTFIGGLIFLVRFFVPF